MSPKPHGLAPLALSGVLSLTGCVLPDDMSRIQKDVADVQQQMRTIQREQAASKEELARLTTAITGDEESRRVNTADLKVRVDEVARQLTQLEERVGDTNLRIDRMSQDVQENRELARRAATPPPVVVPPAVDPAAPGPSAPGSSPNSGAGAVPGAEALYNAAYADFSKGNFALAVSGFEEYVSRYPASDLADNALYWVGECHFSQGSFQNAVAAYDRMLEAYPKGDRAAAANLKKGLAFLELNQVGQAIVQLRYVVTAYPSSDEARIARDKLASLGASVERGTTGGRP